jgi:hypothetical protein
MSLSFQAYGAVEGKYLVSRGAQVPLAG